MAHPDVKKRPCLLGIAVDQAREMVPWSRRSSTADYTPEIAAACLAVGTPAFGETLLLAAKAVDPLDPFVIAFVQGQTPSEILVVSDKGYPEFVVATEDYLSGRYADDPCFRWIQRGTSCRAMVPFSPGYWQGRFRHFVEKAGIVDSVPCVVKRGNSTLYSSFLRFVPGSRHDTDGRMTLGRMAMILTSLAAAHWSLRGPFWPAPETKRDDERVDEVLVLKRRLGRSAFDLLTEREQQVCFHIILGYSSEAIGLRLGVTTNTVNVFRKRAYEKLGIVSQAELFSRYLRSLPESALGLS